MYVHPQNQLNDTQRIRTLIEENGFAILITQVDGLPWATHLPLLLDKDEHGEDILLGHFAKANPAARQIKEGELVLAIFSGAHAYISSSWYDHL
ncbi:MAG: FMN-binding negative transcriptional regulator, partial [Flammeovirgaceae bacterium]|nr:FMN-binding negative transcriptional regulator [Flammeovirgaceae bacterium]MDW8287870.1 FMN-binding negative transcriptional regulator [Flammeovirgaceae bacterium]